MAVTVAISLKPSYTLTAAPAPAVPDNVAVVAVVIPSVWLTPESANEAFRLGAGANVSTVIVLAAEAALRLPATSICLALKLCVPSVKPVRR